MFLLELFSEAYLTLLLAFCHPSASWDDKMMWR